LAPMIDAQGKHYWMRVAAVDISCSRLQTLTPNLRLPRFCVDQKIQASVRSRQHSKSEPPWTDLRNVFWSCKFY
jgi:hypothetical protein